MRTPVLAAIILSVLCSSVAVAEIDNGVLRDTAAGFSINLLSGWRFSDQPSYPGIAVWLRRTTPQATIWVASEPVTKNLICSWPEQIRHGAGTPAAKYAYALIAQLRSQRIDVSTVKVREPGIDNELKQDTANVNAGFASAWFEYSNNRRFIRHAIIMNAKLAITVTMSSPTADARSAHIREFETMRRSIRALRVEAPTVADNNAGSGADANADTSAGSGSGAGSGAGSGSGSGAGSDAGAGSAAPPAAPAQTDEEILATLYQSTCVPPAR